MPEALRHSDFWSNSPGFFVHDSLLGVLVKFERSSFRNMALNVPHVVTTNNSIYIATLESVKNNAIKYWYEQN